MSRAGCTVGGAGFDSTCRRWTPAASSRGLDTAFGLARRTLTRTLASSRTETRRTSASARSNARAASALQGAPPPVSNSRLLTTGAAAEPLRLETARHDTSPGPEGRHGSFPSRRRRCPRGSPTATIARSPYRRRVPPGNRWWPPSDDDLDLGRRCYDTLLPRGLHGFFGLSVHPRASFGPTGDLLRQWDIHIAVFARISTGIPPWSHQSRIRRRRGEITKPDQSPRRADLLGVENEHLEQVRLRDAVRLGSGSGSPAVRHEKDPARGVVDLVLQ